ncbi:hypothetical protein F5B20DRAFT_582477 [Whalleya microplaca]|nr:hypothetical protein F5B20DRAFT_582477 [Whalleya microplaca]
MPVKLLHQLISGKNGFQSFHQTESHHRSVHQMKGVVKALHRSVHRIKGSSEKLHGEAMQEDSEDEEAASDGEADYIPPTDRRPNNDKDGLPP